MKNPVRLVGMIVTVGLIAVSLVMNFRFGQALGRTAWDGLVYGVASACADGFKVILPFAIAAAWRGRRRFAAVVGGALWLVFTAYSMTSSLGHSSVNRAETVGARQHARDGYRDVRRMLEMKLQERERVPAFRPWEAVQTEIAAAQKRWEFESSRGCVEEGRETRKFCDGLRALKSEEAAAQRARSLDDEIATLKAQSQDATTAGISDRSDAQTAILKELSGLAEDYVRLALTVMVSIMVEMGSGLGLYVVLGRHGIASEGDVRTLGPARRSDVEDGWLDARVDRKVGAHESDLALYRDYCLWVVQHDCGPALTLTGFREWLAQGRGLTALRKRGRNYYAGVELRRDTLDARALPEIK